MATIAEYRPFALAWMGGAGPPGLQLPLTGDAESESELPGSILVDDGAGLYESNNAAPTIVVGILERATPAAVAAGDRFPVTLILPNFFYEVSPDAGTPVRTDMNVLADIIGSNAAAHGGFFQLDLGVATAAAILRPVMFASDLDQFVTGGFIDQAAISPTAGNTTSPQAGAKGVSGDTTARLICTFTSAACLWVG